MHHRSLNRPNRFEVAECARRLLLACIIGVADADSAAAPVLGIFISLFYVFVFQQFKPYKKEDDNRLAILLAFALVAFFVAALMIKVDATSDSKKDQDLFGMLLIALLASGPLSILIQLAWSYSPCASIIMGLPGTANKDADKVDDAGKVERKYRASLRADGQETELAQANQKSKKINAKKGLSRASSSEMI